MMDKIFVTLIENYSRLSAPFPYEDSRKMQRDFKKQFDNIGDYLFNADFNQYSMLIIGTLSYVRRKQEYDIPENQLNQLKHSFFESFPVYKFIENDLINYPELFKEYVLLEQTRKLLIEFLKR